MPNSISRIMTPISNLSPPISRYSHFPPTTPKSFNYFRNHPLKTHFSTIPSLLFSPSVKVTASSKFNNTEWNELKQAFDSAESTQEMLNTFNDFETCCDDDDVDLGLASAKLAEKLHNDVDSDPDLILSFGNKASVILTRSENYFRDNSFTDNDFNLYVTILRNLWISGLACVKLERYDESLGYLNRASKIGDASSYDVGDCSAVLSILSKVENEFANVKMRMCMPDEDVVPHFRKGIDIQEKYSNEYDVEFGYSCMNVCMGYVRLLEFEEALPFCLKAVKIFRNNFGKGSLNVAEAARYLATIYGFLGEHRKAIEQIRVCVGALKNYASGSDDLVGRMRYKVVLGRYHETVVVVTTMALLNNAQAYCHQGNFADAKRSAESCRVYFGKKADQMSFGGYAAAIFNDLSIVYGEMNEPETAMSYLEKLIMMTEKLPLKLLSSVAAGYFLLICATGMAKKGVPYLEVAVRKLKESFGSKHFEVGNVYLYLGSAYLTLREPETAAKLFTDAKDIMDASVGPHHENAIKACQGLFRAYENMGRYRQAIEIQKIVIERLKGKEPRVQYELDAAVRLLEDTKEKAGL